MKKLLEKLLFALMDHQNIAPTLAQIALEGYSVEFRRDGDSFRVLVVISKYDAIGATARVSQMIDSQLMLEKLVG